MKERLFKLSGPIALGLSLVVALLVGLSYTVVPPESPVARSYSCNVYTEQGCAKYVVASGGEIEIQSGGTFDLQAGATTDFSGGIDLDGSTLDFDADGDTEMVASSDDIITATINSGTGYLVVSVGNLKVGNGTPSTAQDGEDAYVEGGFEADGAARFDSTVEINGNITLENDETIVNSQNGIITTTVAAGGYFVVGTGNLKVGNGTPTVTQDGEDAYIEGTLEADGAARFDSTVEINGNITLENDETIVNSQDGVITTTVAAAGYFVVGTGNFKVGNYTPTVTLDGEDAYIEGTLEADGAARFDSTVEINGDITLENDETIVNSQDGVITTTVAAGGYFVVGTGNLKVGNGAPDVAQDGEDAYVEGTLEADGAARFDGAVDMNSTLDMSNNAISNIGAAGTDFGSDGSLTTALTITITSGGLTVSAGGADVTGSIDGSADVDVGTWLNLSEQSTIALSDGGTITPTGTYQVITSTAEVTTSTSIAIADGDESGDLLILRNGNAANVINVDGTGGNVECKANVALGASDTLTLIWNGSDWNCVSSYDNS